MLGILCKVGIDLLSDPIASVVKNLVVHRAKSRYSVLRTPKPSENFNCYRIGNIEIPEMILVGSPKSPYHLNDVSVNYRPKLIENRPDYPVELKAAKQYLIEKNAQIYGLDLEKLKNNRLVRLDSFSQEAEDEQDEKGKLRLYLSESTYFNLWATNVSLDFKVIPQTGLISKFTTNQTIRSAYFKNNFHDLANSPLANTPGVEIVLVSRNLNQEPRDQIIIRKRSREVVFYREYFQCSASGHISRSHHDTNSNPNPFVTAIEESQQEIASSLQLTPDDYSLIGIALQWKTLNPEFLGFIETGKSVKELLGDTRRDAFEGRVYTIPFRPRDVLKHIVEEKWTPTSALAMILTLLACFLSLF